MWHPVTVTHRPPCARRAAAAAAPALALAFAFAGAGCGSPPPKSAAPSAGQERAALQASPPPLRGLHAQANQLLPGGHTALAARLRALRGYPVVINKWAQWCPPCSGEFPILQRVGVQYGSRVAFLGLDSNDYSGPAAAFLRRFPVSYPSYVDPHGTLAASIGAGYGQPLTVFITPAGRQVFVHAGAYADAAALIHDIRFYVLR